MTPQRQSLADRCALNSLSVLMRRLDAYAIELLLSMGSLRVAYVALAHPERFQTVAALGLAAAWASPKVWTALAVFAAAAKLTGLILAYFRRRELSFWLRCYGLGASIVIWGKLGISAHSQDPGSIAAGFAMILAFWAIWMLLRTPEMPE
jgi:hypothetical protein